MTRTDMLLKLVSRAHAHGFQLRRWFQAHISPEWPGLPQAIATLATEGRYYALIFSHEFACAFWREGARMTFVVPAATYSRLNGKGKVETIHRKPFTRRTVKPDVWQYHLRQMALSADPMHYLERFLPPEAIESIPAEDDLSAVS